VDTYLIISEFVFTCLIVHAVAKHQVGDRPTNYDAVNAVTINNSGMMVGDASLRSTSLNIISVTKTGYVFDPAGSVLTKRIMK